MVGVSDGPAGFQAIREANLGIVLRTIRQTAPCSRAVVAASTGLTKATVSSLVADLIDRGLVCETGLVTERRVGRPGMLLTIDGSTLVAIGLEVNVDYIAVSAVDLLEREVLSRHVEFDASSAGPEACAARLREVLLEVAADPLLRDRPLVGASTAVPALIDAPAGTVTNAPNLGWRDFPLRERLTALLAGSPLEGLPLLVDNDANLGAVAEYRGGHLARTLDLVYLTGEVGIGAGVLMNGELLRGASGFAGEVGHIPLLGNGPLCACGRRGCLESLAGMDTILRRAVPELVPEGPVRGSGLGELVAETARRAEAGDAAALAALRTAGTWLGRAVATLVNLLNPSAVVLGGYFVPLAPWLLPPCRAAAAAHSFAPDGGGCRIEPSALGLSAAARGGAMALIDALDTGALPLPPATAA
ncbi:ROK family transcriptional regulator [Actinorugispora endophytica]|uniref:Putative NBD/HSP70 family sugar kinase n=1 Tax=Actinorugispora endophytica TaxID=1605990 RepID=A0A4R6V3M3_9ACTN|nr:ROK family transcriptional regulator [Actinorugispora endophytica]TDQ50764.1 putative NBD/HSP70 family sugar kinase [Actinorugispora endophytica]